MAIVKMKHLRLAAMQSDREELLRMLQELGCVEVVEPEADWTDPDWSQLDRPDGGALASAQEQLAAAQHSLEVLKRFTKVKGDFLRPRKVLSSKEFFDQKQYDKALEVVRKINDGERNLAALQAEKEKLATQKAALAPWLPLDVALDVASTHDVDVEFGTVSASTPFPQLQGEVDTISGGLAELTLASSDRDSHYVMLVCHRSVLNEVLDAVKEHGWSKTTFRDMTGTARENDRRLDHEMAELSKRSEKQKDEIAAQAVHQDEIKRAIDRAGVEINREEGKSRLVDTDQVFFLEGWIPAEEVDALQRSLAPYACALETEDPKKEEYSKVPVKLKNNKLTEPLNMVTNMYSLPAYGTLDPNPLMAPFFILFYGIMMADMGYGLLMMVPAFIVLKKVNPKGGMRHFFGLLGLCGISTFIMGALTGGFFGDAIPQFVHLVNPESTFQGFWEPWFTPLDDTLMVLVAALILGCLQIIVGMTISFVHKIRQGEIMSAIWEELTWWIVFAGLILGVLGITWWVLAAGGIMIAIGAGWYAKGFGKVTAIFSSLYNHVTGYFGDVLSYSRLMALMLAGSVIAQVFNTLGAIPNNVAIFIIVCLLGNALNFALNLLGCYVHDLRLQCLEYFSKFYTDGGVAFRPMAVNTKYVDVDSKS